MNTEQQKGWALVTAVPGRVNRFIATLVRLMPRKMALAFNQRKSKEYRAGDED
jgi:hypothetical protein